MREVRIKEGMKAKFEVYFAGNPKPTVEWFFEGQPLQNSKDCQIRVKGDRGSLTLVDCTKDMAGFYQCKVSNDLGTDTTRAGLTVASKSFFLSIFNLHTWTQREGWVGKVKF